MTHRKRVLFVDGTPSGVTGVAWWYRAGARAFAGAFDVVHEVASVGALYSALSRYPASNIAHAQVWGHGRPGAPVIAGAAIAAQHEAWRACRGGSVWFRSCSVLQGPAGIRFAQELGAQGVDVAGHLGIIGALGHSWLVGHRHLDERPWWPSSLAPAGSSSPWAPRTVAPFAMTLPSWTFETGALA